VSRDQGKRPHFYDASVTLSLRQQPEGGELSDDVQVDVLMSDALAENEIYVLVHGFNNHRGEAEFAYQGFRDRQTEQLQGPQYRRLTRQLRDTFWPGDAEWVQPLDYVDFMVYPKAVGTARDAGKKLADYLIGLDNQPTINFIGHSLGCRVVLETILEMKERHREALVGKLCLMAAAVPVFMLYDGERLDEAGYVPKKILNLMSKSDRVLHAAFPPGQTAAGGWRFREGFFPDALGRHGLVHPLINNRLVYKASHGDYWGHNGRDGSDERRRGIFANKLVAELFGWSKLNRRVIDERQVAYERETRAFESKLDIKRMPAHPRKFRARSVG